MQNLLVTAVAERSDGVRRAGRLKHVNSRLGAAEKARVVEDGPPSAGAGRVVGGYFWTKFILIFARARATSLW